MCRTQIGKLISASTYPQCLPKKSIIPIAQGAGFNLLNLANHLYFCNEKSYKKVLVNKIIF